MLQFYKSTVFSLQQEPKKNCSRMKNWPSDLDIASVAPLGAPAVLDEPEVLARFLKNVKYSKTIGCQGKNSISPNEIFLVNQEFLS